MGHVVNQMAALNVSDEEKIATDQIESTQYLLSALSELDRCTKREHLREWIRRANETHQDILFKLYGISGHAELIKEGQFAFHRAKALMIRKIVSKLAKSLRIKAPNEAEEAAEAAEAEEPEEAAEAEEPAEDEEAAAEAVGEDDLYDVGAEMVAKAGESEEEDAKGPGPSSCVKSSKKKRFYKIDMLHSHAKARGKIYFDETLTLGHPKKINGVWHFESFNDLQHTFAYYNKIKQTGNHMYAGIPMRGGERMRSDEAGPSNR